MWGDAWGDTWGDTWAPVEVAAPTTSGGGGGSTIAQRRARQARDAQALDEEMFEVAMMLVLSGVLK